MDVNNRTFWDMQQRCISYADDSAKLWTGNPVIEKDIKALKENEKEVAAAAMEQTENDTQGLVVQKNQDLQALATDIYVLNRSLCHLAKTNGDQVLLNIANVPESKMLTGSLSENLMRLKNILVAARQKLPELTDYLVTDEILDKLDTRLQVISDMPDVISVQTSHRKMAVRSIKEIIADARIILDRLDDAFEAIIRDEKFLDGWFDARKIKGRSRRKNNGNGNETDDNTSED
ncbi:MAG: hypothetical protein P1P88_07090 [Bacteroidales bacterium]|nr:hypothetical protein [Bacteroidales bacterium]